MQPTKPLYIYIMARGHSGSTMLELLLNRNKSIVAVGEIDMLGLQVYRDHNTRWEGICSCRERPYDCKVWKAVLNRIKQTYNVDLKNKPFSWPISDIGLAEEYGWKKPGEQLKYRFNRIARTAIHEFSLSQTGFAKKFKNWAENRDFLIRTIAAQRGSLAVVDASKDPLQVLDINTYSKLPFKILFLTRDVRGNAWSALKSRRVKSVKEEAHAWAKQNKRMLQYLNTLSTNQWLHVRYEDLCSDTNLELKRIYSFLKLDTSEVTPENEFKNRHTIAGNKTRFKCLSRIKEDKEWEEHLNNSQLKQINDVAGQIAKTLKYYIN